MSISARRWPLCSTSELRRIVRSDEKIGGARIGRQRGIGGKRNGRLRRSAEAHHDAGDEQADGLVGKPLFEGVLAGRAKLREIAFEQSGQLGRDRNLLGGAGELLEDVLQSAAIVDRAAESEPSRGRRAWPAE